MRNRVRLLAAGLIVILAGHAASAQVTGLVTDRRLYNLVGLKYSPASGSPLPVTTQDLSIFDGSVQNNFSTQFATAGSIGLGGVTLYSVTNYQVATLVDNDVGHIAFAANATAAGVYSQNRVGTTVDVSYTNGGVTPLNVTLASTIIPAGFGAYVSDPSQNFDVPAGDINHHPESATTFLAISGGYSGGSSPAVETPITTSRVLFQILSGTTTVASYDASLQIILTTDGTGHIGSRSELVASGWVTDGAGGQLPLTLNNFALIAADDPNKAVGFRWDATDVLVPLGEIAAGESKTLTYVTIVEADTLGTGGAGSANAQLLAYAGFGDPIGQDGGAGGIADPKFPLINLSLPSFSQDGTNATISAAKFQGYFSDPLPLQQFNGPGIAAVVPEPASWVLMMGGFGLVGGALRLRRPRQPRHV